MTKPVLLGHPLTTAKRPPTGMVLAGIAIAVAVTAAVTAVFTQDNPIWLFGPDFRVYRTAGSAVLHGISPYDVATVEGYPFTYPPFAALVLSPLGLMNLHVAYAVWTFVNVLVLEAAIWVALGLIAPDQPARRAKFTVLATIAALPMGPVLLNFSVGQINVLLMLLILADLARRPGRFQGVAIGIAAGIKLLPLIFIVYFLITRRTRAAAVSAASFAATVLIGFVVMPGASARYWRELVLDVGRIMTPGAAPFNQSMRGVLTHLPGVLQTQLFWLVVAIVVGVAGLAVSAWSSRRGFEAAGIFACAVTGLLVSPVSWPFHWVWLAPGLAVWLWWAQTRQSPAHYWGVALTWLALAASGVLTLLIAVISPTQVSAPDVMPHSMTAVVLLNTLIVVAGLGFLGVLAVKLRRSRDPLEA